MPEFSGIILFGGVFMVIDFHTHAFPVNIAERAISSLVAGSNNAYTPCSDGSSFGLVKNMEKFGVDLSVVQPVVTKPSQTKTVNLWAYQITGKYLISFGGIHPETDDYKRDIDLITTLHLPGIKLHPEYQGFELDDPKMMRIYDYAISRGLMLMFHAGNDPAFPPPVHSSPAKFAKIRRELGGGTIIAAHLGGLGQWAEVEEQLAGEDVYLDTSMGFKYYNRYRFLRIVKKHGADKILFGSDSPWSRADEELKIFRGLPLTAEEQELILSGNAKRMLKL